MQCHWRSWWVMSRSWRRGWTSCVESWRSARPWPRHYSPTSCLTVRTSWSDSRQTLAWRRTTSRSVWSTSASHPGHPTHPRSSQSSCASSALSRYVLLFQIKFWLNTVDKLERNCMASKLRVMTKSGSSYCPHPPNVHHWSSPVPFKCGAWTPWPKTASRPI